MATVCPAFGRRLAIIYVSISHALLQPFSLLIHTSFFLLFSFSRSCKHQDLKTQDVYKEFAESAEGSEALFGEVDLLQSEMNDNEVRDFIEVGALFGLIKCGLAIPERHWGRCLELSPLFGHRDVTMELLSQPLDERVAAYYPYRPDTDKNSVMSSYANKYGNLIFAINIYLIRHFAGLFGPEGNQTKNTLVSPLSERVPKWHSTNYVQYLIKEFDIELIDIGK